MNNKFKPLKNEGDVINLKGNFPIIFISQPMFRVSDVAKIIAAKVLNISLSQWDNEQYNQQKKWINQGLNAETLKQGDRVWQKGKVRIKFEVEFCSDEPEEEEIIGEEKPTALGAILNELRQAIEKKQQGNVE